MQVLGPSAKRSWTLVISLFCYPQPSEESWKPGYQQSDFGSLGLFDSTIDMDVFFLGSSVFGWVFFSLAGMIINPNERSAKKVFPRLKTKASETMCAVKALAVVFRKYMKASF